MNGTFTAKYLDYLISLVGAGILAFGLGAVTANLIGDLKWPIIVVGALIHALGMLRTRGSAV